MSKGILEFSLPEESSEHETAVRAMDLRICIEEMGSWIRSIEKYGDERKIDIGTVRKMFWQKVDESGLSELFR
jgi:hypothetical protein